MTTPIYDEQTLSDLYKDARGSRPREYFWEKWDAMSIEERNAEWTSLCDEVDQVIEQEAADHERAIASYEAKLEELLKSGAADREQAKRWLLDSLEMGEYCDPGYPCYLLGLPYRMETEFKGLVGG